MKHSWICIQHLYRMSNVCGYTFIQTRPRFYCIISLGHFMIIILHLFIAHRFRSICHSQDLDRPKPNPQPNGVGPSLFCPEGECCQDNLLQAVSSVLGLIKLNYMNLLAGFMCTNLSYTGINSQEPITVDTSSSEMMNTVSI